MTTQLHALFVSHHSIHAINVLLSIMDLGTMKVKEVAQGIKNSLMALVPSFKVESVAVSSARARALAVLTSFN